jgi:hypothetical protein
MLDRLVDVLAEVARLPDVDGYLGNPDRDGPTETSYRYTIVPPKEASAVQPSPPAATQGPSIVGIIAAAVAMLLALAGLTIWWASS